MFPIAPVACLGLPLGLAAAARAESPLAEIRLAEIRFAKTAIAAPAPLAKECSFALSHFVALLLRWTPSPAPAWTNAQSMRAQGASPRLRAAISWHHWRRLFLPIIASSR